MTVLWSAEDTRIVIKMTRGQNETEEIMKLREMDEKNMHNLFLKNMAGLIEETKNPSPCTNP